MEGRSESLDECARNFELNSIKDGLKILLADSGSTDEACDLSSNSITPHSFSEKKKSPSNFPLSRETLHEQLFGVSELRKDVPRAYSTSDVPVGSFFDFAKPSPRLQMPKSSPGMMGANYSLSTSASTASLPNSNGVPLPDSSSAVGFGDKHFVLVPPPIDVNLTRYVPPVTPNQYSGYPTGFSGSFSGKTYVNNVSNTTIAISPSYHTQYPYPRSNPVSPHVSPPPPMSTGKENPNLHYRPNRDVQIANLAKAKAEREAAAAAAAGLPPPTPDAVTPPPSDISQQVVKANSNDSSDSATAATKLTETRKPNITYVYLVALKTSSTYCLISPTCSLNALSMNELVVFAADGGEEIGFVSHILTMKAFMDQQQLTNETVALTQLRQIIRAATEVDRRETAKNRLEEANIVELLFEMNNRSYHLPISILDVQYQLDRKKLTICYRETMEGAVMDGRELMKELFLMVQTRIVMKKVTSGMRSP